jgi:hypothetical protein
MKGFLQLALCGCLAAGVAMAQRGGGHSGGGGHVGGGGGMGGGGGHMGGGGGMGGGSRGFSGGGFRGGGAAFSGGGFRGGGGGFRGGFGGFRGGFGGFNGGFRGRSFGFRSSFGFFPSFGFGSSYWPGYYDYGYGYGYPYDYSSYPSYSYPAYQPSSNVTVVYPQTAQAAPGQVYAERANPNLRQYDEYGQEMRQPSAGGNGSYGNNGNNGSNAGNGGNGSYGGNGGSGSPLYLLAFRDQSIRAAVAYWVDGRTLHYVTQQHEERQASLDTIDRDFTLRLNHERHVPFSLAAPQ